MKKTNRQIRSVRSSDGKQAIIAVEAGPYEYEDDCLAAAAADYVADHPDTAGWDLAPAWEGDQRDVILLTVPVE